MKKITIAVATHKKYQMPKDNIYLPIECGAVLRKNHLDYIADDSGDNISEKNKNYSELTALYWLWKNNDSEYKGLAHYILPKLRHYYIETIESHYKHTHFEKDLLATEEIIKKLYPDYLDFYYSALKRKSAHMFNMFIMKDKYFNNYCEWLFSILFELEKVLDISEYSPFHARVFGRVSEILLDVWIFKNNLNFTEIPVMFMEKQNWWDKSKRFISAKLFNKKYY